MLLPSSPHFSQTMFSWRFSHACARMSRSLSGTNLWICLQSSFPAYVVVGEVLPRQQQHSGPTYRVQRRRMYTDERESIGVCSLFRICLHVPETESPLSPSTLRTVVSFIAMWSRFFTHLTTGKVAHSSLIQMRACQCTPPIGKTGLLHSRSYEGISQSSGYFISSIQ